MSENNKESYFVRKISFIVIVSLIIILLLGALFGFIYVKSALKPVNKKDDTIVSLEIPLGSSSSDIAKILEDKKIINNEKIFRLYIKLKNKSEFQAGNYDLSPSQTIDEIIEELQSGKLINEPLHTVTIPEGKTLEQIAEIYAHKFDFTAKDFMKVATNKEFINELKNAYPNLLTNEISKEGIKYSLEGYLFPSTYEYFEENPKIKEIITSMVEQTNKQISKKIADKELDFTVHELLTLASIIERESKFEEDRPKVAQVFINRIADNMKLQSDITAAYALGEHKVLMSYDDIAVKSPYNTYVAPGLPIGPINSPSAASVNAVINPEGEEFKQIYFYARPSGETLYANTLEEHNKIKKEFEHEWHELKKDE